ncbi:MAG: Molybdenum ABC transporter permease protein ModB, partial [uncultured Solirubrobacterales bacterium]
DPPRLVSGADHRRARRSAALPDPPDRRGLPRDQPGRAGGQPGEPGCAGSPVAEPQDDDAGPDRHRARGHPGRLPAGHPPVPRALGDRHARRAAARPAAGRRGHRAARGRRARRPAGPGPHGRRDRACAGHGRCGGRADLRRLAVLPPPGPGRLWRARSGVAGGLAHLRGLGGEDLPAHRGPGGCTGPAGRRSARAGPSAGRVRRDADLRRLLPGHHPDGAAGHLRPLRDRLRRGAGALSRARRRLGGHPARRQARAGAGRPRRCCAL